MKKLNRSELYNHCSTVNSAELHNTYYPLDHFAVIEVAGDDAARFLQGQLTCNVTELNEIKGNIAAFCNPKGRVISTLLLIKQESSFIVILPRSLVDTVAKKLRMYILRAKVVLTDRSESTQLLGLLCPEASDRVPTASETFGVSHTPFVAIRLPSSTPRFLCLINDMSITPQLDALRSANFRERSADEWRWQDITTALPWFDAPRSEQFIPQMLNLDLLGGVSFNKGCYTGQEIVARTHFLGKSKRQLYLAECGDALEKSGKFSVLDAATLEKQGEVLCWQSLGCQSRLLLVLQIVDEPVKPLILDDDKRTALALISCQ